MGDGPPRLVALAARALAAQGPDGVRALQEVEVPSELEHDVVAGVGLDGLLACLLCPDLRLPWALLTAGALDAHFEGLLRAFFAAREARRRAAKDDFLANCDLDDESFWPAELEPICNPPIVAAEDPGDPVRAAQGRLSALRVFL
jgi:hypothetical protein